MQGPRLYRFFNYENMMYLPAPTGGWMPDVDAWTMPTDGAVQLDNFVIMPGKIRMRAPINVMKDLTTFTGVTGPINACGCLDSKYSCFIGRRTGNPLVDAWLVPVRAVPPTSQSTISTAGIWLRTNVVNDTIGGAWTFSSIDAVPGFRSINFDGLMYAIGAGSATTFSDVNNNYQMPATKLLTTPVTPAFPPAASPTVLSLAPQGAVDLISYQSRIWLAQGVDIPGAGTTHSCTTIFFTNPGVSGVGSATSDWKDPVAGTTNKIEMDQDSGDPIMGFAIVRNGMLVLRYRSVWLLRGTTTANYTLIPISRSIGCMDPRSICETDHGVYFISSQGLMLTNGTTVQNVSGFASFSLRAHIAYTENYTLSTTPAYQVRKTRAGKLLVSIGACQLGGSGFYPFWSAIYDPYVKNGAWVRFTSNLFKPDTGNALGNTYPGLLTGYVHDGNLSVLGDKQLVCVESGGSTSLYGDLEYIGQGNNFGLYDNPYGATTTLTPIPAVWRTKLFPSVGTSARTRSYGITKLWTLDYQLGYSQANGTGPPHPPGWTVQPVDYTGTLKDAPVVTPLSYGPIGIPTQDYTGGNANLGTSQLITRISHDFALEHSDIGMLIQFLDTTPPAQANLVEWVTAEIYGVSLESQGSREYGHG